MPSQQRVRVMHKSEKRKYSIARETVFVKISAEFRIKVEPG